MLISISDFLRIESTNPNPMDLEQLRGECMVDLVGLLHLFLDMRMSFPLL